jgi:phosphoglycolate phosphatase-like HAD superfamily hydrolase
MAKHIVWDWNGTLVDDLALTVATTNAVLQSYGGTPVTVEQFRGTYVRPVADYYRRALRRAVTAAEFARMDKAFHDAYNAGFRSCALMRDAVVALRTWQRDGRTQSVLSMLAHDDLTTAARWFELDHYFNRVDGRRTAVGGDAKARLLVEHLTSVGAAAEDCVLVGDTVDDAMAAAAAGTRCVLFTGGLTSRTRLLDTGRLVAETLSEAVRYAVDL